MPLFALVGGLEVALFELGLEAYAPEVLLAVLFADGVFVISY